MPHGLRLLRMVMPQAAPSPPRFTCLPAGQTCRRQATMPMRRRRCLHAPPRRRHDTLLDAIYAAAMLPCTPMPQMQPWRHFHYISQSLACLRRPPHDCALPPSRCDALLFTRAVPPAPCAMMPRCRRGVPVRVVSALRAIAVQFATPAAEMQARHAWRAQRRVMFCHAPREVCGDSRHAMLRVPRHDVMLFRAAMPPARHAATFYYAKIEPPCQVLLLTCYHDMRAIRSEYLTDYHLRSHEFIRRRFAAKELPASLSFVSARFDEMIRRDDD